MPDDADGKQGDQDSSSSKSNTGFDWNGLVRQIEQHRDAEKIDTESESADIVAPSDLK